MFQPLIFQGVENPPKIWTPKNTSAEFVRSRAAPVDHSPSLLPATIAMDLFCSALGGPSQGASACCSGFWIFKMVIEHVALTDDFLVLYTWRWTSVIYFLPCQIDFCIFSGIHSLWITVWTAKGQLGKKPHRWAGKPVVLLFLIEHAVLSALLENQSVIKDSYVRASTTINWHTTNGFETSH